MADYGIGIDAITDRPDPERLASGLLNFGNSLARRILTTNGSLLAIGDDAPYETLNLRDWLGARPTAADIQQLNASMQAVLEAEEDVDTVTASATFIAGRISVEIVGTGAAGPFGFVIEIDHAAGPSIRELQ